MVANSPSKNLLIICIRMASFITCFALVLQNITVLLNENTVTWLNWDLPCSYMPLCRKCFGWKPFSPPLFSSIGCLHHLSTWPPHILFSIKSHHLMIFFELLGTFAILIFAPMPEISLNPTPCRVCLWAIVLNTKVISVCIILLVESISHDTWSLMRKCSLFTNLHCFRPQLLHLQSLMISFRHPPLP